MSTDSYLRAPKEQKFYRMLAFLTGIFGLNSHYWSWYSYPPSKLYALQRRVVIIFLPVTVISMIFYVCFYHKVLEFNVLASVMSILPFTVCLACKLISAHSKSYKIAQMDFMDKIQLHTFYIQDFPDNKHELIKNLILKVEKYTRLIFYLFIMIAVIGSAAWTLVPVSHNFKNNYSIHNITTKLEVSIYLWQPFDYEYNFYAYLVVQVIASYSGLVGVVMGVAYDTLNVAYVLNLIGHIHIFKYDLKMGQEEELTDNEWEHKLKEISNRYYFITKTFKNIERAYGFNITSIYAFNLVEGGLLLYQLTSSSSDPSVMLTYSLMLPFFMGILITLSIVLENVRIQADDIPNLVYALPWESMSISNQKLVLFILLQVQPTLQYVAAFNIEAGVWPAITILKTTFSYYVMIKARKEI